MKEYSKYKDSGVDWIGKIPVDWNVFTMGQIGRFDGSGIDKKINKNEVLVKMISYTDIYNNKSLTLDNKKNYMIVSCSVEKLNKVLVKKGDLIFTPSSETAKDIGLSSVVIENLDNTIYSYHVLRYKFSEKISINFSKYICNNYFVLNWFSKLALGTIRKTLSREDFRRTKIILPPLVEQKKIADFLDNKTEKIDALISDKEKLIELFKEQRRSIISETVTKGLDKKAEMKPSGVEWIGDIPKTWKTIKLKYITSQPLMYGANEIGENGGQNSTRYIRVTDIDDNGNLKTDIFKSLSPEKAKSYLLNIGDILFARSGSVGKTYFHKHGKACFAGYLIKFSPNITMVYPKYVYYITLSNGYKDWVQMNAIQATIKNVSAEKYNNFSIPLPSLKIQHIIVTFLDKKTSQINNLIENLTKQIKKLQEYRKSIVSEAVTGKAAI